MLSDDAVNNETITPMSGLDPFVTLDAGTEKKRSKPPKPATTKRKKLLELSVRAQEIINGWLEVYKKTMTWAYVLAPQDVEAVNWVAQSFTWEQLKPLAEWFLVYYLETPLGKYYAKRYGTVYAPTLEMFVRSLNDIPFTKKGRTPHGYWVEDDGEVKKL